MMRLNTATRFQPQYRQGGFDYGAFSPRANVVANVWRTLIMGVLGLRRTAKRRFPYVFIE